MLKENNSKSFYSQHGLLVNLILLFIVLVSFLIVVLMIPTKNQTIQKIKKLLSKDEINLILNSKDTSVKVAPLTAKDKKNILNTKDTKTKTKPLSASEVSSILSAKD